MFRLQFDDFQIVSSSHDDTILIWDFLDLPPNSMETDSDQSDRTATAAATSQPLTIPQQEVGDSSPQAFSPDSN